MFQTDAQRIHQGAILAGRQHRDVRGLWPPGRREFPEQLRDGRATRGVDQVGLSQTRESLGHGARRSANSLRDGTHTCRRRWIEQKGDGDLDPASTGERVGRLLACSERLGNIGVYEYAWRCEVKVTAQVEPSPAGRVKLFASSAGYAIGHKDPDRGPVTRGTQPLVSVSELPR